MVVLDFLWKVQLRKGENAVRLLKKMETPFDLGEHVRILPSDWPHPRFKVKPGDFSIFVPYGNDFYGYQPPNREDPFKDAPSQDAYGGIVYFSGGDLAKEDFFGLLRIVGIRPDSYAKVRDYAVFVAESGKPVEDGYVRQVRIVPKLALRYYFKVLTDVQYKKFPQQTLAMEDVLWSFIEAEQERWVDLAIPKLMDEWGDMAYCMLGFGFMQENAHEGVCRIWSRPWLLTK